MANEKGFDIQGLLGNPLFNIGTGLLAAGLDRPRSFGQALGQGLQFGSQQQAAATRNQFARERILAAKAQREVQAKRQQAIGILRERLKSGDPIQRNEALGLLAQFAPQATAQGLLGHLLPKQSRQTTSQLDFPFFRDQFIKQGFSEEEASAKALDAVKRKGTTINVGTPDKPFTPAELKGIRTREGRTPPVGTTPREAREQGMEVIPRQPTAEEARRETQTIVGMDTLQRLKSVVTKNKIEPGFISEGGIAQFMATPAGQVFEGLFGETQFGQQLKLTPPQADALSLQVSLSNQLIAAMRGASVGPEEQEKFERQLPLLTQPKALFFKNLENTERNLKILAKRQKKAATGTRRSKNVPRKVPFNELPD